MAGVSIWKLRKLIAQALRSLGWIKKKKTSGIVWLAPKEQNAPYEQNAP